MADRIFREWSRGNPPSKLWLFFLGSLLIHGLVIQSLIDVPPGKGKNRRSAVPRVSPSSRSPAEEKNRKTGETGEKRIPHRRAETGLSVRTSPGKEITGGSPPAGEMRGAVRNRGGKAISGIKITAIHLKTGTVYRAVTDGRGKYVLKGILAGRYDVRAESPGTGARDLLEREILLKEGEPLSLDFKAGIPGLPAKIGNTEEAGIGETDDGWVEGETAESVTYAKRALEALGNFLSDQSEGEGSGQDTVPPANGHRISLDSHTRQVLAACGYVWEWVRIMIPQVKETSRQLWGPALRQPVSG